MRNHATRTGGAGGGGKIAISTRKNEDKHQCKDEDGHTRGSRKMKETSDATPMR